MKVFSLSGIVLLLVYAVVIDRVLSMIPNVPYVSPLTAGLSLRAGGGTVDAKVSALQSLPVIVVAAFAVYLSPKFF